MIIFKFHWFLILQKLAPETDIKKTEMERRIERKDKWMLDSRSGKNILSSIPSVIGPTLMLTKFFFRRPVGSIGQSPVCRAGGRGFQPRPSGGAGPAFRVLEWMRKMCCLFLWHLQMVRHSSLLWWGRKTLGPVSLASFTVLILVGRKRTHTAVRKE